MISKWIIDLQGFERYRFGEDKNLYKLPFITEDGKSRGLKLIKKDKMDNRWEFRINGKIEKWSENQLRKHLIIDKNPIELTKINELPF